MALVRSLLLLSLSLLLAVAASADSDTTTFQLTGGLPFCSQCGGVSEYACSSGIGKWKSSYIVSDPVPSGSVVTQLEVTLTGSFACNNTANVIEIDVNGVPIDIHTTTSKKQCACDSCDGTVVFTSNFLPVGLPNYAYGGSNNFTLSIFAGTICLNVVNITTSWGAPVYPGTVTAMRRWTIARYSSPHVCNGVGYDNSASISLSFVDPLPPGSLLLLSTAQVFGSYWCYSTSSTPSITVYLDSTQVGTIRLTPQLNQTAVCSYDYQCNSGVWATGSPMYQTGWPNYKYGGSNTVRIDTVFYPRIGQLALYMLYYTPGDSEVKRYIMPLDQE